MKNTIVLTLCVAACFLFSYAAFGELSQEERTDLIQARELINKVLHPEQTTKWLGTNLSEVRYYSTNRPFHNIFKTAGAWKEYSVLNWRPTNEEPITDEHGWITELRPDTYAMALILRQEPNYPAGDYTVEYDGEGTLLYRFSATKNRELSEPGHDIISVLPSKDGIALMLMNTNPENPIRNIRIYFPGEENETEIFRQKYLDFLNGYSTLRFMDWMRTNWSTVSTWESRSKPEDATYTTRAGIPLEIMCALSNKLNSDPWFCIPHMATDNFVRQFASMTKSLLDEGLTPYFEYSNEVWNGGFGQAIYCRDKGLELGLDTNQSKARVYYYSRRSVEIFQIIEEVYENSDNFVRVIASQAANSGVSINALTYQNAYEHVDALAIAPYFGGNSGTDDMSLSQFMEELEQNAIPRAIGTMNAQKKIADEYGVALLAYEGGQHLVANTAQRDNPTLNELYDAANRDNRMETLYKAYLTAWKSISNGVFLHYSTCGAYTEYGRWGSIEYLGQEPGPKARVLRRILEND